MKKILPVEELARDSRFVRVQIQEAMMDPRQMKVAERNTGPRRTCGTPATVHVSTSRPSTSTGFPST